MAGGYRRVSRRSSGQLDLVALCEDLQADGIESHGDQAMPSSPASSTTAVCPRRSSASRRLTQAESAWTCATLRQRLELELEPIRQYRVAGREVHDEGVGQGILRESCDHFIDAPVRPSSASAASREMKRTERTPRAPFRRTSTAAASALAASFARKTVSCGSTGTL